MFSLAGRAAPGLYAAAWTFTLAGFAILVFLALAVSERTGAAVGLLVEAGFAFVGVGLVAGAGSQALQRRADGRPGFAGPSPFLTFAGLFFALAAVEFPVERLIEDVIGIHLSDAGLTLVSLLVNLAGYVALVQLLVVGTGALSWREILHPTRLAFDPPLPPAPALVFGAVHPAERRSGRDVVGDVLWAVALLIPLLIVTDLVAGILLTLLGLNPNTVPQVIPAAQSSFDRFLNLVSVAIVAPIGEETFFRGYATNAWARTSTLRRAIATSALFFAFVHVLGVNPPAGASGTEALGFAVLAFGARLPVSVALAWLYLRRRSLYASVSLHALFNGALLLLSWAVT